MDPSHSALFDLASKIPYIPGSDMWDDGLHLSAAGYRAFGSQLSDFITEKGILRKAKDLQAIAP